MGREFVFRNPCRGPKRKLLTDSSKNGSEKGDVKEKKPKRHRGVCGVGVCGGKVEHVLCLQHKRKQAVSAKQSSSAKRSTSMKQSKSAQAACAALFYKPMSLRER